MNERYSKNFIIRQSAKLFYYKGYKNTELTDIFKECQMPNDVFYKYFSSKEEVLVTVIKYHTENLINFFNNNVDDLSISKFRYFFEKYFENIQNNRFHGGSPLGNLALELSDINRNIREELVKSYKKIELRFSFFITTLKYAFPEKYADIVPETAARILIALLEGTILILKTEKESTAINDFFIFFDKIFLLNDENYKESLDNLERKNIENQNGTSDMLNADNEKNSNIVIEKENNTNKKDINKIEKTSQTDKDSNDSEHLEKSKNDDIDENNIGDDDDIYDIDSDSLINVFNALKDYHKDEFGDD